MNISEIIGKGEQNEKYLLVYYGGKTESDPKKTKESMGVWIKWFQGMGKAVVDMGAPTLSGKIVSGESSKKAVAGEPITGYTILQAESLDKVTDMAKKSPQITAGGQIGIFELIPMYLPEQR